jgi:hypothetical protein
MPKADVPDVTTHVRVYTATQLPTRGQKRSPTLRALSLSQQRAAALADLAAVGFGASGGLWPVCWPYMQHAAWATILRNHRIYLPVLSQVPMLPQPAQRATQAPPGRAVRHLAVP